MSGLKVRQIAANCKTNRFSNTTRFFKYADYNDLSKVLVSSSAIRHWEAHNWFGEEGSIVSICQKKKKEKKKKVEPKRFASVQNPLTCDLMQTGDIYANFRASCRWGHAHWGRSLAWADPVLVAVQILDVVCDYGALGVSSRTLRNVRPIDDRSLNEFIQMLVSSSEPLLSSSTVRTLW